MLVRHRLPTAALRAAGQNVPTLSNHVAASNTRDIDEDEGALFAVVAIGLTTDDWRTAIAHIASRSKAPERCRAPEIGCSSGSETRRQVPDRVKMRGPRGDVQSCGTPVVSRVLPILIAVDQDHPPRL